MNTEKLLEKAIKEARENTFPSLKTCIELHKAGLMQSKDIDYYYKYSCEEVEFNDFDLDGDIDAQIKEIEQYSGYKVGEKHQDTFDEFTVNIVPAPSLGYLESLLSS